MKPQEYYNTYQLKLPVDLERILEISDSVYTFCEVLDSIGLYKYLVEKEHGKVRPRYDPNTLLRVILFAFMEYCYVSTRMIEKQCKTDIRFMWLLNGNSAPSHMTIDNFMKNDLVDSIENIFAQINNYIFAKEQVDLFCEEHGMEKYMKFTMFKQESENERYHNDPYRAVNFHIKRGSPCMSGRQTV